MLLEFMLLASALYLGFNIGSNDAANCMGACVGGGALSINRAVAVSAAFVVVGGLVAGRGVSETIAGNVMPAGDLTTTIATVCLLVSGLLVTLATFRGIPVSTSHAIVLAMVGAGLAIGAELNGRELLWMSAAWALLPLAMILLSFATFSLLGRALSRVGSLLQFELTLKYLLILAGIYASFALGANHAGLAGGLLQGRYGIGPTGATLVGSTSIAAGALIFSRRVIATVGSRITSLGPTSAFAMQFSAAVGLSVCSFLGIPVSSSQAIVGAAVGVGLAQGVGSVDVGELSRISLYWVGLPVAAMLASYLVLGLL